MKKRDFPFWQCKYNNLNEYLKKLPGDEFFYFDIECNTIRYLIDYPDWVNFFPNKETM